MKRLVLILPIFALAISCDTKVKTQLADLAHADSLRSDSIVQIKNEMLDEVMSSTQFMNDLNGEIAKLKVPPTLKLSPKLTQESALNDMKSERAAIAGRIKELVARLDSSQARLATLRERAKSFADRDSLLETQVAEYEKTISDLRQTLDRQRADFQATVDQQNQQIAALHLTVDTVTKANLVLSGDKAALTDTVHQLTTEKNTAYYVVGTRTDLLKEGIVVEEGHRPFLFLGSRPIQPARDLDSTKFTKINRLTDRSITFPDGEYTILSRQDPEYATPLGTKDGKITGGIKIDQPEKFWAASRFLVVVRN
ncbi:MAG TPA: hypothetical protein VMH39_17605 [Gemmatimonadaceae bacterium]|nr:hypothetical protein [Gemmatimonadaceae bacterium]